MGVNGDSGKGQVEMESDENYGTGGYKNTQESNLTISVTESGVKLYQDSKPEEEGDLEPVGIGPRSTLKACEEV